MINIRINNEWAITSDAHNFILNRVTIGKSGKGRGKEKLVISGYFQKMEDLIDRFVDKVLYRSDCESLIEVSTLLREIKANLQKQFRLSGLGKTP